MNCISELLVFKIFCGGMPPDSPSGNLTAVKREKFAKVKQVLQSKGSHFDVRQIIKNEVINAFCYIARVFLNTTHAFIG